MTLTTSTLPPKQEAFCQGIVIGKSATQAYRNAGYSGQGADVSASRLLGDASVRARLTELRKATEIVAGLSRAQYLNHSWGRFLANTKDSPKYGEMIAKAMGWNAPERRELNERLDIVVVIGGSESHQYSDTQPIKI